MFLDLNNLYHTCKRDFNRTLDPVRLAKLVSAIPGLALVSKYTYSTQIRGDSVFQRALRDAGYITRVRMPRMDRVMGQLQVALTLDVVKTLQDVDQVIVCASNCDYLPLIDYAKDKIVFLGVRISREIKSKCPFVELTENEFAETANKLELFSHFPSNVPECVSGYVDPTVGT